MVHSGMQYAPTHVSLFSFGIIFELQILVLSSLVFEFMSGDGDDTEEHVQQAP